MAGYAEHIADPERGESVSLGESWNDTYMNWYLWPKDDLGGEASGPGTPQGASYRRAYVVYSIAWRSKVWLVKYFRFSIWNNGQFLFGRSISSRDLQGAQGFR